MDQLFSQIDADRDGKITKQELTDGVKQLSDALDVQFNSSRIARASIGGDQVASPPPPRPSSDEVFAKLDTKNQGYIDKEELQTPLQANANDVTSNSDKVDQIFTKLDTDGDNKISKAELSTGSEQMDVPEQPADSAVKGVPTQAGAGPIKPAGGAQPAGVGGAVTSESTSYEAADANKDGTVSLQELAIYQASHPAATSETDAQNSLQAVIKIMEQLTQTYGQFDQSIASTASSVNMITATA